MTTTHVAPSPEVIPTGASAASLRRRLESFRRTHHYREIDLHGVRWRYLVSGKGTRALLLPSGGTRLPDMYLLLFEALEADFSIVAPAYPAVPTMHALVEGLSAIADTESLAQIDLFGSSFGGFVAQCLVRQHPERVRRLILANTGAPGTSPLPALGLLIRLFARLPESLVRWGTGRNWRRWLNAPPEQRAFWWGLLDELLSMQLTKADLVSALAEMHDYATNYRFTPRDLSAWPGRVLLIESAHDEAFTPAARAALRDLYPGAQVRTFPGGGHAVMITDPAEYVRAVRTFLDEA